MRTERTTRTTLEIMAKNLRSRMDEDEFQRFKGIKAELGAETNDEAMVKLMDFYQEHQDDG